MTYCYDASSILSFGQPMRGRFPQAEPDEVVIWYSGWSMQQLCENTVVQQKNAMYNQDWYNKYDWSTEVLPVGFYRLKIPVAHSNNKLFDEQTKLLTNGEQIAHPVLVATAELCHYLQTGEQLLRGIWVRTSQQHRNANLVELYWNGARLDVFDSWSDKRNDDVFLASVRYCI